MPSVSAEEANHSTRLRARIAEQIAEARGWISFADYMQTVLYEPGLGYYSAGAIKLGEQGDFVTAPELSPFFAHACARTFDRCLRTLADGEGEQGAILEFGPGSGKFATQALTAMQSWQTPLQSYQLLEVSADLRAIQQKQLAGAPCPVTWLDRLPKEFTGVMFGNEVIDAMPAERFVIRNGEFWRLGVGCRARTASSAELEFEWRARPADGACADDGWFSAYADRLQDWLRSRGALTAEKPLPEGYCGEWHPALAAWVHAIAESLTRGVVILADYGLPRQQLYLADRSSGSLRCHQRHYAHGDPFLWPGLTDITTWVDFTAVAEAAVEAGLQLAQFTTQASFLLSSGASFVPASPSEAQGLRQLLLPGEMGEAVKFMVLTRDFSLIEALADERNAAESGVMSSLAWQDLRGSLLLQDP